MHATATRNNQQANQHNAIIHHRTMDDDTPPIKPWGKADKKYLQELIDDGKVDIRRTTNNRYIDRIHLKFFCKHDEKNFRCNFQNYAQSRELEDHLSGYRWQGGIVFICNVI
jgi:hypothetical protein